MNFDKLKKFASQKFLKSHRLIQQYVTYIDAKFWKVVGLMRYLDGKWEKLAFVQTNEQHSLRLCSCVIQNVLTFVGKENKETLKLLY